MLDLTAFVMMAIAGCMASATAFAEQSTVYPFPAHPAGVNSAIYPAPRIEWLDDFAGRVDHSRKMAQVDIIFDGDSITDWWQNNGRVLWDNYVKLNAVDFAIAGDRTQHVLWRLQQGQVDNLHPKLVFLMIGTNNLFDNTPDEIAEGIKAIVDEYRKRCPEAVIILQAVFPREQQPDSPLRVKIKATNALISKYDDGSHVVYLDLSDKFLQPDGTISKEVFGDYLHPTAKGYQIWADAIQPIIAKYLPAAPSR